MKVLVTGFERFGKHELNPSQLLAEALDGVGRVIVATCAAR